MFGEEVVAHLHRADALGHVISFSIYLDCATHHLVPCETEVHRLFGVMGSFHNSCIKSDRGVVSPSFFCELAQIVDPSCQIMIVNRCFHSCRHKVVCICPHLRGQLVIVDL